MVTGELVATWKLGMSTQLHDSFIDAAPVWTAS